MSTFLRQAATSARIGASPDASSSCSAFGAALLLRDPARETTGPAAKNGHRGALALSRSGKSVRAAHDLCFGLSGGQGIARDLGIARGSAAPRAC